MKLLRTVLPLFPIAFLLLFVPLACMQGTESGTETGMQGIQGGLSRDDAASAAGAEVYAFRRDPAARPDSAVLLRVLQNPDTLRDTVRFRATLADARGRYRFTGLAAGDYGILGFYSNPGQGGKWVGYLPSVKVTALSITQAADLDLRRVGGITAVVAAGAGSGPGSGRKPLENVTCHIPGLSYVAFTDESGRCTLLNIPEGSYTVEFDNAEYVARKLGPIQVVSGSIAPLPDTVVLVLNPAGPPPAPKGFRIAVDEGKRIAVLAWDPAEVPDVAGYILFRKPIESVPNVIETPLTDILIRDTVFRDTLYRTVPDTADFACTYRLAAVDAEGNRSAAAVITPVHVPPSASPIRFQFTRAQFSARESDAAVVAMVRRLGPADRPVSVKWNLRDSTAVRDSDYLPLSGELVFAAGDTLQPLHALLVKDDRAEGTESFAAVLHSPGNGAVLADPVRAVLSIQDDDTAYAPVAVDFTKAYTSHNAVSPGVARFPGGLYDGDTLLPGLIEFKSSNPDLIPKPVADWDFKDCGKASIPDLSGNGHDGLVQGSLVCKSDSAGAWAQFSNDDTVTAKPAPDLDFRESMTVTALVKPDSTVFRRTLVGRLYWPTSFALEIVDGQYNFGIVIEDGTPDGHSYVVTAPAVIGEWTHVTGTYDGALLRIFINGELINELSVTGPMKITDRPVTIGNHPEWSTYAGGIREIKLFKQALNGYQVREQMRLGVFPSRPLSVTFAFDKPVWTMGAGAALSGSLGTGRYSWSLAGADTQADMDGKSGSFMELASVPQAAADAWSRQAYKARPFKIFRFTVTGLTGTGFVQINELSLIGAERITPP